MARDRNLGCSDDVPPVAVVSVIGVDNDGILLAKLQRSAEHGADPLIYIQGGRGASTLKPGDHALVSLTSVPSEERSLITHSANVIRKLDRQTRDVLGLYKIIRGRGRVIPTNRKHKQEYDVERTDATNAKSGDLVHAQVLPGRRLGLRRAKIVEILADIKDPRAMSLIAAHGHGIPGTFPDTVVDEANSLSTAKLEKYREDLRTVPLVTIDGEDARDFDDAVYAEPDTSVNNKNGWIVWIAVADVSYYVRSGSPLDKEAFKRGNSTYFPDRVIPMLPEALSNDLCSLMPEVDRACLAVRIIIGADGTKREHRFTRGLMRSAARLTYNQVQKVMDGETEPDTARYFDRLIKPLYGAYTSLYDARHRRDALELELPERQVIIDDAGKVTGITVRDRKDSHKLIEEFMILANVAAAEELERLKQHCMYRVHEEPPQDKIQNLTDFLRSISIPFAKDQVVRPKTFNRLLERVRGNPEQQVVNDFVLRTQTQAYYSPANMGHFGLALKRYAHFTSPIRRYADLLIHRTLVRGLKLGPGGIQDWEINQFERLGEAISLTERRSLQAERETIERFIVNYMTNFVDNTFEGRVVSVKKFGIFIRLSDTGAEGLIPITSLSNDYFNYYEDLQMLVGTASRLCFRAGENILVKLSKADALTGSLQFELLNGGTTLSDKELKALGLRGKIRRSGKKAPSLANERGKKGSTKKNKSSNRRRITKSIKF